MKKHCIRALAICLLLMMVLTGCSSYNSYEAKLDPNDPVSLEIWHYYNGPQKLALDAAITEFNDTVGREKGIIVEAFSQGNISELTEKVIDAANKKVGAGDIPAIFAAYADTAYQVDELGLVAELDKYFTSEELSQYVPEYLEEGRFDAEQSLKIFPIAKSTEVFMLNTTDWDKFAQATGATKEDLQTFEGIARTAKAYYEWTDSLTAEPNDGKAFFGRDAMANYILIGAKQLGTEVFEVKNGNVTLNLDKEIFKKLWDNYYVPYISGYFTAVGRFRSDDAKTGDLIALVGSTSGAAYFPEAVTVNDTQSYPIDVEVFSAPIFQDAQKYVVQQGAGMVVSRSDERTEYAATVFLKWFTQAQRNIDFSIGSGYLPVKTEANTQQCLKEAEERLGDEGQNVNLEKALPVAIDMTGDYTFYTSKAFKGGTQARNVLEYSMSDRAKEDRKAVEALIAGGVSHDEAVARYNTQQNFDAWFAAMQQQLNETIQ